MAAKTIKSQSILTVTPKMRRLASLLSGWAVVQLAKSVSVMTEYSYGEVSWSVACFCCRTMGLKSYAQKGGRSRRQHSVSVQIYISMPYTNLGTKRHRHRKHLFEGNIQYKGCGTKRTMVKASNLFVFLLFSRFDLLFIRLSTEVFAVDRWKWIHVLIHIQSLTG